MKNFTVYKSSAGSGKTYTLAVNYLALAISKSLIKRDYYKKILAITFTNKAAQEMKERVLYYLNILSQGKDIDNILSEIISKTRLESQDIFKISKNIYSHILHNYSDLSIQTIDKFSYKIVKTFSSDLGMNRDFELELDSNKIIQPVIALLLNKVSDNNSLLTDVLVNFTIQKLEDGNSNDIQSDLEDFCKHLFIEGSDKILINNSLTSAEVNKLKNNLFEQKSDFKNKIISLRKEVVNFFENNGLTSDHFSRGTFYKLFNDKLLSKKYSDWIPSESLINSVNNADFYSKSLDENLKQQVDRNKEKLKQFFDDLLFLLKDYITLEAILKKIYPSIIINELINEINTYKKENNIQHISSFNRQIHEVVTTQVSSFIFERLGERYNHFLIDEFQDTSLLQWQNLLPLIADSLDFGKSIVVGDGKQSIYRWRAGEVEQFLKLPEIYKGEDLQYFSEWQAKLSNHFKSENLDNNFRSRRKIIEFNNLFFKRIKTLLSENLIPIYDDLEQKVEYANNGGYVRIELFNVAEYKNEVLEKTKNQINKLINENNYSYKDFAVLCNTHKDISEIASYLTDHSIPIISSEGLLISNSPKVKLIISSIKYLVNIDDKIAKASIINYLFHYVSKKDDLHILYMQVHKNDRFLLLLNNYGIEFDGDNFLELPIYQMVEEIIKAFKIENDVYINFFLDLVHEYSEKNINSISQFIEWWSEVKTKKSISISDDVNAVKLMTIHKSKGLAFPIVIIPFNWESATKKEMWVENSSHYSKQIKYSLINQNKNLKFSHFNNDYNREKALETMDNINKLYVACTRAVDGLYILSKSIKKVTENSTNLNAILQKFTSEFPYSHGSITNKNSENKNQKSIFIKEIIESKDWKKIISLKNSSSDFWDNENHSKNKDWGKLFHYALSEISHFEQINEVVENLYVRGKCDFAQKNELLKEINNLFSCTEIQEFFSPKWKVRNEKEILMPSGKTYIPDRIMFNNNQVVIIDYKTGEKDSKHLEQIVNYSNALNMMGFNNIERYLIYTNSSKKIHKV